MNQDTIGKDFKLLELAKFVAVPILSRFFISALCTLDDGLFISRCCGEYSLAAFSLLSPYFNGISIFGCLVYGVSTLCSIKLGEKKKEEAESIFTTMVYISLILGFIIFILISLFKTSFLRLIGATDILFPYADEYLTVAILYIPLLLSSEVFAGFFTIAGKPSVGAYITVIQTICNFFFDWLFMVEMRIGLAGTAWSNFISNAVIFIIAIFFFKNKKQEFHFSKPSKDVFNIIKESFRFGQSDALTCLILCFTGYIINNTLLNTGAEETLAAYAIVNTLQNMFIATFSALFGATSPLVAYAYGEKNKTKIIHVLKQILALLGMLIILDSTVIILFRDILIDLYLYASTNLSVREMATFGLTIIPFTLPLFGLNKMTQTMFIAIDEQKRSITLSLIENALLANIVILIVPRIFGANSIWYCFLIRESLMIIFTIIFVYHYLKLKNIKLLSNH